MSTAQSGKNLILLWITRQIMPDDGKGMNFLLGDGVGLSPQIETSSGKFRL